MTREQVALKRAAMIELWTIDPRLRADPVAFGRACNRYWRAIQALERSQVVQIHHEVPRITV